MEGILMVLLLIFIGMGISEAYHAKERARIAALRGEERPVLSRPGQRELQWIDIGGTGSLRWQQLRSQVLESKASSSRRCGSAAANGGYGDGKA